MPPQLCCSICLLGLAPCPGISRLRTLEETDCWKSPILHESYWVPEEGRATRERVPQAAHLARFLLGAVWLRKAAMQVLLQCFLQLQVENAAYSLPSAGGNTLPLHRSQLRTAERAAWKGHGRGHLKVKQLPSLQTQWSVSTLIWVSKENNLSEVAKKEFFCTFPLFFFLLLPLFIIIFNEKEKRKEKNPLLDLKFYLRC